MSCSFVLLVDADAIFLFDGEIEELERLRIPSDGKEKLKKLIQIVVVFPTHRAIIAKKLVMYGDQPLPVSRCWGWWLSERYLFCRLLKHRKYVSKD